MARRCERDPDLTHQDPQSACAPGKGDRVHKVRSRALRLGAAVLLAAMSSVCAAAGWVQTWGAAPLPPSAALGPMPATPSFDNQTIRQTVRVSIGGQQLRIRFSNEYGTKPLVIGRARVAVADEHGNAVSGTERDVLFSGRPTTTIPAGAPFLSDPIDLPVGALSSLSISLYLPEATGPCTCHATGMQNAFVSDTGDFTGKAFTPKQTVQLRAFISGVEVHTGAEARAVVVLGDSISDGIGSTVDANHRWPDLLADMLERAKDPWGVVNMGISGNQLLSDGAGQSALARFDRDVLSVPGVRTVIIFEGVNDLGISYGHFEGPMAAAFKSSFSGTRATRDSMIAGYEQLIARAHARGVKVLAATITPYEGASYYSAEGEAVRTAINTWIRTAHKVDGVIDFDAAMRDPARPTQIREGLHAGDHLHGSDAGYRAMAAVIDLALFK
ncbi:MAG TPA: SGNH/GDSL hydrolase family protein [Steroidobacteraceae bacterium]|nr:SGNH/GDSL hydrolase family protein [Steroidobacteraceae bacterium]